MQVDGAQVYIVRQAPPTIRETNFEMKLGGSRLEEVVFNLLGLLGPLVWLLAWVGYNGAPP